MDIPDSDATYYRIRERHERDLAEKATLDEARIIHQTLADKYRSLASLAERVNDCDIVPPPGQLAS